MWKNIRGVKKCHAKSPLPRAALLPSRKKALDRHRAWRRPKSSSRAKTNQKWGNQSKKRYFCRAIRSLVGESDDRDPTPISETPQLPAVNHSGYAVSAWSSRPARRGGEECTRRVMQTPRPRPAGTGSPLAEQKWVNAKALDRWDAAPCPPPRPIPEMQGPIRESS